MVLCLCFITYVCSSLSYSPCSLPPSPSFSQRAGRAYATNRYRLAHELYSEAICVDLQDYHTNALLFANRAAALMNMGRNKDALKDCVEVSWCRLWWWCGRGVGVAVRALC